MAVRAILLDLDNTLLAEDDATLAALRRASAPAGERAEALAEAVADAAGRLFAAADVHPYADRMGIWWGEALWGDFGGSDPLDPGLAELRAFVPGFRLAVWAAGLAAAGIQGSPEAFSAAFARERRSDWGVDPAAMRVLDALAVRYRLAIVTNGAPEVQREKLAASGIAARVPTVIISGEIGIGKPEPGIFRAALDRLGVRADEAVFVGDSVERDIAGARRAGLRAIWIDRERGGGAHGDARITSLDELPGALDALGDPLAVARRA